MQKIKELYEKNHKKLLIIPLILVLISLGLLMIQYGKTGDIIQKDVSLEGGITATIETEQEIDINNLKSILSSKFGDAEVRRLAEFGTDKQIGIIAEISETKEDELRSTLEEELNIELTSENYSTEIVGSSLGEAFYKQLIIAVIFAFLFMGIVVLITFRSLIPSLAVVLAALFDIICTLAVLSLMDVRLSSAGIAAILLLIGYSIDTDVLLTTRVLKRKEGAIIERVFSSIKTGLTMTLTTTIALTVGYLVSSSFVIKQIFLIIVIGLIIDVIMTYFMNAPILMMYVKKKESK